MKITKGAQLTGMPVTDEELELINKQALEPLTAEQVFVFKIAVCDNEVDRDFEVFPTSTLKQLAPMFVGRTIMKDHQAKADNQVARIYATEVAQGTGTTKNGETYAQLVARCYMAKTASNADMITEIQAGIKREVSVGCGIGKAICSICGLDNREAYCKHWGGREYDGKQCYFKLEKAIDAYEVSFVAVPAQPAAGVTKNYTGEEQKEPEVPENNEQKDLIEAELSIVKSFIFTEKERGN